MVADDQSKELLLWCKLVLKRTPCHIYYRFLSEIQQLKNKILNTCICITFLLSSWHPKQNLCFNKPFSSRKLYTTGWKSTIIFQEWNILEPVQATCHVQCTSIIKNNLLPQIRKHECLSLQNVKCFSHEPVSKVSSIFDSWKLTWTCGCPRKMIQNVYIYIYIFFLLPLATKLVETLCPKGHLWLFAKLKREK